MPIQWDAEYEIGIEQIDKEHQRLVELVNMLESESEKDDNLSEKALGRMRQYAREHFTNEETLMEAVGYSELPAHKKLHHSFIQRIVDLEKDAGSAAGVDEILTFLKKWLLTHIMEEDKKIAEFMW